ncbi:hypothetical protein F5Y19DRAFT_477110 [Xylariaceae sp. FL1651]|nr:hypothetical protein F5Y19DRAFT_477110 [Xylariaceae sp. FL1651]
MSAGLLIAPPGQVKRNSVEGNMKKEKRNTPDARAKDHEGILNGSMAISDKLYVFNRTQCAVLNHEGEARPFYVRGEYVQSYLKESEPGVEIVVDAQFIDINTCEPI